MILIFNGITLIATGFFLIMACIESIKAHKLYKEAGRLRRERQERNQCVKNHTW